MKNSNYQILSLLILTLAYALSAQFIEAQDKLLGELTIESNPIVSGENFITLNGERVISGRSLMSPADIETPAQTSAKISIAKTGIIKIAPESKMNLYFESAGLSGDFLKGSVTVDALPYTKFNILTSEGAITVSSINNENVFVINQVNNKTRVNVLAGELLFNGVLVIAGQTYPVQTGDSNAKKDTKSGGAASGNVILIALGAAGAIAVIAALALSGGGNNDNTTVSPVR